MDFLFFLSIHLSGLSNQASLNRNNTGITTLCFPTFFHVGISRPNIRFCAVAVHQPPLRRCISSLLRLIMLTLWSCSQRQPRAYARSSSNAELGRYADDEFSRRPRRYETPKFEVFHVIYRSWIGYCTCRPGWQRVYCTAPNGLGPIPSAGKLDWDISIYIGEKSGTSSYGDH